MHQRSALEKDLSNRNELERMKLKQRFKVGVAILKYALAIQEKCIMVVFIQEKVLIIIIYIKQRAHFIYECYIISGILRNCDIICLIEQNLGHLK